MLDMLSQCRDARRDINVLVAFKIAHTVSPADVKHPEGNAVPLSYLRHERQHDIGGLLVDILVEYA